jgi:tRNA (cytidine/uridine-2'-O-)-methyltransferase
MRSLDILREGRSQTPYKSLFDVVLIEPDIPQNTGNIGRTCVGTRSNLHLVGEMGFEITDKNLKRAGLDYWQHLNWRSWDTIPDWESQLPAPDRVFYFSAFAEKSYYDVQYKAGDTFVFGKETKGLPEDLMRRNWTNTLLIPIFGPVRGFNVATAVSIVLYEALRQVQPKP